MNAKKLIDHGFYAEFQGTVVHDTKHWLGCGVQRRIRHLAAALTALGQPSIYPKTLKRLIGKGSYIESFRSCLRSIRQERCWVAAEHRSKRSPFYIPAGCWGELLVSAILVPLASHDLDSEYCTRVAMYDAAPGGHGRTWATMPLSSVTEMAQAAD
eukprot:12320002-Heterocapsa_arctica.AAC.1